MCCVSMVLFSRLIPINRIFFQVIPNAGPVDDEGGVINEQHAIHDIEDDVKMRGEVGQAPLGRLEGRKADADGSGICGCWWKDETLVEG